MAAICPTGFNTDYLLDRVRDTYDRVAREPGGDFHFHRGAHYAQHYLGYDAQRLAQVPRESTDRFAGVGNPHLIGSIGAGEVVLDHACGAGTDLLIAASQVGVNGRAIGVDVTPAMIACARAASEMAGLSARTEFHVGNYDRLPLPGSSVDVVLSNGVLNLAPDKAVVLAEVLRVLKPGGRLYLADVVVQRDFTPEARGNPDLWAACVAGALCEPELAQIAGRLGFVGAAVTHRFDCFGGTSAKLQVAEDLRIGAVNFYARKPWRPRVLV